MNPVLFVALTFSACAVAHYSVVFLEPAKSSVLKAGMLNLFLVVGSNAIHWTGATPGPVLEWCIYITGATVIARVLFKLKFTNCITVGACYVAGSYVLAHGIGAASSWFVG